MTATAAPSRPSGKFIAAAALGGVLLLDAAIETLVAGSPVRWWVVGAALLYTAATASFWRLRVGWSGQLALAVFGVLGLVAATAWAPAGLIEGVRLLGQPTARVLAACAAAGVALAGFAIARSGRLPLAARIVAAALAAYGAVAFAVGALEGATLPAMFSGHSLWQRLPAVLQGAFVGAFIVLPIGLVWAIATAGLRRPAETSWRADLWKIAALVTSFAIVLAGTPLRPGGGSAVTSAGNAAPPETFAALAGIDPNAPPATPEAINTALANSLRAVADGDQQNLTRPLGPGICGVAPRIQHRPGVRVGAAEHLLDPLQRCAPRTGRRADGSTWQQPGPQRPARDAPRPGRSNGPARARDAAPRSGDGSRGRPVSRASSSARRRRPPRRTRSRGWPPTTSSTRPLCAAPSRPS